MQPSPALVLVLAGVFFFLLGPPPSFTLFPYTTLFRSPCCPRSSRAATSHTWPAPCRPHASRCRADRKSTRLNSSHVDTSYAVFCLKKENYQRATGEAGFALPRHCHSPGVWR